jgi:hypothetical protein
LAKAIETLLDRPEIAAFCEYHFFKAIRFIEGCCEQQNITVYSKYFRTSRKIRRSADKSVPRIGSVTWGLNSIGFAEWQW